MSGLAAPAQSWRPSLGAWPEDEGVCFRVWAPRHRRIEVVVESPGNVRGDFALAREDDGYFGALVRGLCPGARYRYRLDGEGPYPDPASRFQPEGVHGPSEVVDPGTFRWSDGDWAGLRTRDLILYELHVGTFSPDGSFAGVAARLPHLQELGVTAVELMPVGDFPGRRNWGYDGVALFAPARVYGRPDDFRRLVDRAHALGLGVVLDVVYNHFGPDGAYHGLFSPFYRDEQRRTPWGSAINFAGDQHRAVRDFFIENALHWVHEYHLDGLRLDATHAMSDGGPRPFVAELAARLRGKAEERRPLVIAEDRRNLACMLRPADQGGWAVDAVWADDFHHQLRRCLAGDREGYYRDYTGTVADIAETVRRGWFYCGQRSEHWGGARGTDPEGLAPRQFVVCIQNHDQVGNRALGERLSHQIDPAAFRAASVLLLCVPETPLLFMGQEWAAATPFLYFTDHNPEIGQLVTESRRLQFKRFSAFKDPAVRARIPDPQTEDTFARSHLRWEELAREPHASVLRLYRALLALRRSESVLLAVDWSGFAARSLGMGGLLLMRQARCGEVLAVLALLKGAERLELPADSLSERLAGEPRWELLLSTEDAAFVAEPMPIHVELSRWQASATFTRPGAVVLATRVPGG